MRQSEANGRERGGGGACSVSRHKHSQGKCVAWAGDNCCQSSALKVGILNFQVRIKQVNDLQGNTTDTQQGKATSNITPGVTPGVGAGVTTAAAARAAFFLFLRFFFLETGRAEAATGEGATPCGTPAGVAGAAAAGAGGGFAAAATAFAAAAAAFAAVAFAAAALAAAAAAAASAFRAAFSRKACFFALVLDSV